MNIFHKCIIFFYIVQSHLLTIRCSPIDKLISFFEATSSSVRNDTPSSREECKALNAIQRGTNMWCSKEITSDDEVVTWTGKIKDERIVKGVRINWGLVPKMYMIETSLDGETFNVVIQWKEIMNTEKESLTEDVIFPDQLTVIAIKVSMRQPIHHFFGINFIAFLASGHPLVMLTGGMTSPNGETCLQAEHSDYEPGTSIVLDKCINAIQRADGRELFIYNDKKQLVHDMSQLCVTLKDNVVIDGGEIILDDCESNFSDGRNQFEVLYDNRLRILRAGDFCLTQEGKSVGNADVAFEKLVTSKYSRYRNEEYTAEMAVDGNFKTYWVSQEFDYPLGLPESVDFSLDLGGVFKITSIGIHWVFPAASYEILISHDNQKFERVMKNMGNSRNFTQDFLEGRVARYLKLNFLKPHPTFSVQNNKAVYGISQLAVYSNKLKSVAKHCDEAALSKDAREKYFFTVVAEFDPSTGLEMNTLKKKFDSIQENISRGVDKVENLLNSMKDCTQKIRQRRKDISSLSSHIDRKKAEFNSILRNLNRNNWKSKKPFEKEKRQEFTDCYEIFLGDNTSINGFYFITSACDGQTLRVYCDMETQRTIYLYQIGMKSHDDIVDEGEFHDETFENSKMVTAWEPKDTVLLCEKIGMIPFVPQNMKDVHLLEKIKTIITQKDIFSKDNNVEHFFPIGFFSNNPENAVLGLDLQTNISGWIGSVHQTIEQQVIGLATTSKELKISKWPLHLSGTFCSTESSTKIYKNIPNITCETVLRKNPLFDGCPYSSTIIRCVDACSKKLDNDSRDAKLKLFGTYTYRDDSSLCLAAEHSGVLGKHGLVNVTFLPGFTKYEGSLKNGIKSESYNGVSWDRSFTVSHLQSECKKKNKVTPSSVSFLQTINSYETTSVSHEIKKHLFDYSDDATDTTLKELLTFNSLQMNDYSVAYLVQMAKTKISESRSYLKPAERLLTNLEMLIKTENTQLENLLKKIYNYQQISFNKLHGVVLKIQNLQEDVVSLQEGTKSFNFDDLIPSKSSEIQSIFNEQSPLILMNASLRQQILTSLKIIPDKKWFFTSLDTEISIFSESHDTEIEKPRYGLEYEEFPINKDAAEVADLREANNFHDIDKSLSSFGLPIYMKNKKLYDGTLSLKYKLNNGGGLFAVAFRVRSPSNMSVSLGPDVYVTAILYTAV